MKTKVWIVALLLAVNAVSCAASLELSGYIVNATETKFVFTDLEDKVSSGWITIGQTFRSHTVIAFDPKREVVSVRNGDRTTEIALRQAHVRHAMPVPLELADRGIALADLVVRNDEGIVIFLSLSGWKGPPPKRFVDVEVRVKGDTSGIKFGGDFSGEMNRAMVPEKLRSILTDSDISEINRKLHAVRLKWLPEPTPSTKTDSPNSK